MTEQLKEKLFIKEPEPLISSKDVPLDDLAEKQVSNRSIGKRIREFMREKIISTNTYTIYTVCDNCGKRQKVSIPKGTASVGYKVTCCNCGVSGIIQTLVKENKKGYY